MAIQDDRRQWILTNWPHLVELEQITALIAEQEPLAHWPTVQPDAARVVLEQLRRLAPELDTREERTLAELDRQEIETDPVRQLEARRARLHGAVERAVNAAERDAVQTELDNTGRQLRNARRERTVDDAFGRYETSPIDEARTTRITTLTHDTLATQPTWLVDHIRELHDNDQLNAYDITDLATRTAQAATQLDRYGDLPDDWHLPIPRVVEIPTPPLEIG
jgi:hypothetical protein